MAYLTLLLAILLVHKALCEATFWDTAVRLSETMTLECVYPLTDNLTQVEWNKINGTETVTIAVYIPNHRMHIHKNYLHRVHFPNSTVGFRNMSLSFYNASETDIGIYTCLLSIFPSGLWEKKIKVVQSDSFAILAPSDGYLYAEPGQNVTLSCQLPRNWPVQQVMWERVQPHQVDILASCNLSQGTRYTSKYLRKIWSTCSQESMQSVVIPNAMAADSGLYRCRSEASTGEKETFVIRLILTDGGTNKHFILLIAGGSVSLLLIILIIIIIIFYNRRRRRQVRTPLKEPRDKQSKVATNCRSPTSPIHSIDDDKEDIYVNYPTFSRRPKPRF